MKLLRMALLIGALALLVGQGKAATLIYHESFTGTGALNGSAPDQRPGAELWLAGETFQADGSLTGSPVSGSAWLPYSFGQGLYEVTLGVNLSGINTGFLGVSLISGNPTSWSTGPFNQVAGTFATFAVRRNGEVEFWAGERNAGNIDLGVLPVSGAFSGTLRLVLDTLGSQWAVETFYRPSGGDEIAFDLNPSGPGTRYLFATNPPAFTGIGITANADTATSVSEFTFARTIPEPSTLGLAVGLCGLLLGLRRFSFL